jgi:hypothetical protein
MACGMPLTRSLRIDKWLVGSFLRRAVPTALGETHFNPDPMAKNSQQSQETSATHRCGGTQAIVELGEVSSSGLTFWSRHRFEIGSELQIRLHRDALPTPSLSDEEWVNVCGFVIDFKPVRRSDGAQGFCITLLFDSALLHPTKPKPRALPLRYQKTRIPGLKRMGLN